MLNWQRSPAFGPLSLLLSALVLTTTAACSKGNPSASAPATPVTADTWAVVDGHAITRDEVDKAYRRSRDTTQPLSDEEALTAKLGLLNDMIIQQILIAKAATMKIEVSQADLDTAYNNAKRNLSDEAYQQELSRRNLTAAEMREGLRREMLMQKVIEQEVGSKIAVTDKEINDFFAANRAQFNVAEESYHIAQIVITPVKEQQVSNGTGDDATTPQAAADKAKMLMERLKSGASFRDLAVGYSEDAESAARGGDMGFIPVSRLKQAPPALRDSVLNKQPGSVNVAASGGAYTLVLVVAHEQAGQRDLTTPGMKERITETLRGRKEQLLRLAYLTSTRTEAKVDNYLAKRLIEAKGEVPGLMPSPPAK